MSGPTCWERLGGITDLDLGGPTYARLISLARLHIDREPVLTSGTGRYWTGHAQQRVI